MSRSYKKNPVGKTGSKGMKRIANQRVRNYKGIPSGMAYKKVFPSWNINDYISRCTWEEYIFFRRQSFGIIDEEKEYQYWCKCYKRK